MGARKLETTISGGRLVVDGVRLTERWLEPRPWWQFWRPLLAERSATWEEVPSDSGSRPTGEDREAG